MMLPWVDRRITESFVLQKFRGLDWGNILKIDMVWRNEMNGKPGHYKAFIHFGNLNPTHGIVFEHLDTGKEIKVDYNTKHYWKVRKSQWEPKNRAPAVSVTFL